MPAMMNSNPTITAAVIPDDLKGRSGIHGAAFQPFQRRRCGSMDSGFAPKARPGMTALEAWGVANTAKALCGVHAQGGESRASRGLFDIVNFASDRRGLSGCAERKG